MKRHSPQTSVNSTGSAPQKSPESPEWGPEQENNDPVWNMLGQASDRQSDPFFARNVVRSTRLIENTSGTWLCRVTSLFTPRTSRRLALGTAAIVCALVTYQMWPSPEGPGTTITETSSLPAPLSMASTELSELVIEETLDAAAEDPTIFTHDEVVAMIGF